MEATERRKRKRRRTQGSTTGRSSKHRRVDRQAQVDLKRKLDGNEADLINDVHALLLTDGSYDLFLPPPDGSLSHELEKSLWKAHHCKITEFRSQLQRAAGKAKAGAKVGKKTLKNVVSPFIEFIASSSSFYSALLSGLRLRHGLDGIAFDGCKDLDGTKSREFRDTCYRLLLRLGDLARYKEIYGVSLSQRNYDAAEECYSEASKICHCEGGSHGQLAILATYTGDRVRAVYHYIRSLFAKVPSPNSYNNLQLVLAAKTDTTAKPSQRSSNFNNTLQLFQILLLKTGFKDMERLLDNSLKELEEWLSPSFKDCDQQAFLGLQIVTILIACIQDFHLGVVCKSPQPRTTLRDTISGAFKLVRMLAAINDSAATMLPALVVFMTWLSGCEDVVKAALETDELRRSFLDTLEHAEGFFQALSVFSEDLFPRLGEEAIQDGLWEDHELQGFVLLRSQHELTDFGFDYLSCDAKQLKWKRLRRLEASLRRLAGVAGLSKGTASNQVDASSGPSLAEPSEGKVDTSDVANEILSSTGTLSTDLNVVLDRQLLELMRCDMEKVSCSTKAEAETLMTDLSLRLDQQLAELKQDGRLAMEFFCNGEDSQGLPNKFDESFLFEQIPSFPLSLEITPGQQVSSENSSLFLLLNPQAKQNPQNEPQHPETCEDLAQAKVVASDGLKCIAVFYSTPEHDDCLDRVTHVNPLV